MFPSIESEIIQAVYLANNENVESTINQLLEMNDPTSKPILDQNNNAQVYYS